MAMVSMRLVATVYDVTVSSTALTLTGETNSLGFTDAEVEQADYLMIQVLDAAIREKHDGDAPAVDEGWLHTTAGDGFAPFQGEDILKQVQVIRDGGTNALINAALYRGA